MFVFLKRICSLLFIFAALYVPATEATTITYEGVAPDGGTLFLDGTMVIGDFQLTTNGSLFVDAGSTGVGSTMPSNGTDYIRPSRVGFFHTIELVSGNPFSLISIDAADRNNDYAGGESFLISGIANSGATLMQTFTTPLKASTSDPSLFTTFSLTDPAWTNVRSITIGQSVRINFDNVITGLADPNAPSPIPETGTLALFGLGLAVMALARRKKA